MGLVSVLFTAAAAAAVVGCSASTRAASPTAVVRPEIVALGDSLTVSPTPSEAYPAVLERRLHEQGYDVVVHNAGRNGDTSADALRRLDAALTPQTRLLIVALGANDGIRGVPVDDVQRNLSEIIERAQTRGIRVLLCGMVAPPRGGIQYSLSFYGAFRELAARYDLPLVPFLLLGVLGNPDLNQEDFVHPNAAGARVIADTIWPYLLPMVEQLSSAGIPVE